MADEHITIQAKLKDGPRFERGAKGIARSLDEVSEEARELDQAFRRSGRGADYAAGQYRDANGRLREASGRFAKTRRDLDGLDAAYRRAGRGADRFGRDADRAGRRAGGGLGKWIGLGAAGVVAGGVGAGLFGLAAGAKASALGFAEADDKARALEQTLRTTGRGRMSRGQLDRYATRRSLRTGIDDEDIMDAQIKLATFKGVRSSKRGGDIFSRAIEDSLDLSIRENMTPEEAAKLIGKALQDPSTGGAQLKKTGSLSGTDLQKLKDMAEDNVPVWKQQIFLLEALEGQYKGAADASGEGMGGALRRLSVVAGNTGESIGEKLSPHVISGTEAVTDFLTEMNEGTGRGGAFKDFLGETADKAGDLWEDLEYGARRVWPELKRSGQDAWSWYQDELQPEVEAFGRDFVETWDVMSKRASRFWDENGDEIIRMLRAAGKWIGNITKAVVRVGRVVMAVVRGDWTEAWDIALGTVAGFYEDFFAFTTESLNAMADLDAWGWLLEGFDDVLEKIEDEWNALELTLSAEVMGRKFDVRLESPDVDLGGNLSGADHTNESATAGYAGLSEQRARLRTRITPIAATAVGGGRGGGRGAPPVVAIEIDGREIARATGRWQGRKASLR